MALTKIVEYTHSSVGDGNNELTDQEYIDSSGIKHICHTTEGACADCHEDCVLAGLEEVTWVSGRDGTENSCMTNDLECAYCTNEDCPYCSDYDW